MIFKVQKQPGFDLTNKNRSVPEQRDIFLPHFYTPVGLLLIYISVYFDTQNVLQVNSHGQNPSSSSSLIISPGKHVIEPQIWKLLYINYQGYNTRENSSQAFIELPI